MEFQDGKTQKIIFYQTEKHGHMPQTNEELPVENQK